MTLTYEQACEAIKGHMGSEKFREAYKAFGIKYMTACVGCIHENDCPMFSYGVGHCNYHNEGE